MNDTYYAVCYGINYDAQGHITPYIALSYGPFSTKDDAEKCAQALNARDPDHVFQVAVETEESMSHKIRFYIEEYYISQTGVQRKAINDYGPFDTFEEAAERATDVMKRHTYTRTMQKVSHRIVRKEEEV